MMDMRLVALILISFENIKKTLGKFPAPLLYDVSIRRYSSIVNHKFYFFDFFEECCFDREEKGGVSIFYLSFYKEHLYI
jgi:hypothetical protein